MSAEAVILLLTLPVYGLGIAVLLRLSKRSAALARQLRRAEAAQRDQRWTRDAGPAIDLLSRNMHRLQHVLGRVFIGSRGVPEAVPSEADLLDDFLRTHPDPNSFRSRFPHIQLVLPDEPISTAVNGRPQRCYFAQLDGQGRICGGEFR